MRLKNIIHHIFTFITRSSATMEISSCNILEGKLPAKQIRLAAAWIEIHREELLANWALCQNGEKPFTIEPLK